MYSIPHPKRRPQFLYRGHWLDLDLTEPNRTLLDLVRTATPTGLGACGTKEGCAQGDCGACAVLLGELAPDTGALQIRAVNACIRLASSIEGCALWTVEDLMQPNGALHPVQQAMVDQHGSQCGFCTPGFVVSLAALYEQRQLQTAAGLSTAPLTRDDVLHAISGNLCRCTGYRPIVAAGLSLNLLPTADTTGVLDTTDSRGGQTSGPLFGRAEQIRDVLQAYRRLPAARASQQSGPLAKSRILAERPRSLDRLLRLRAAFPEALVIAGTTDTGLWINKQHRRFERTIDVTSVAMLHRIRRTRDSIDIGAAARLTEAFDAICREWPSLSVFCSRFAGMTIRNSATLGGNIANGSPIGDSMPLLIALGASLTLASIRGQRNVNIDGFFLGYRRTALADDEIITAIHIPRAMNKANESNSGSGGEFVRAYKISKRFEDDISAVCLAMRIGINRQGTIVSARVGAGGVAAVPARAQQTEAMLVGRPWCEQTFDAAAGTLVNEFQPISDMRASADYRRAMLSALTKRFWIENNGARVALDSLHADELLAHAPKAAAP